MRISPVSLQYKKINFANANRNNLPVTSPQTQMTGVATDFPWLKNMSIEFALNSLKNVTFSQNDVDYINAMGLYLPFLSGEEAIKFMKESNVRIGYIKMDDASIHAQYDYDKNFIGINDRYKDTNDFPVILAISEAIFHEAGHAKDNDGKSSVQEELECLSLNVLAHKYHKAIYPDIFKDKKENIIADGVELYTQLFFDNDPLKKALIKRVQDKYGFLPAGDEKHPPALLASTIANVHPIV